MRTGKIGIAVIREGSLTWYPGNAQKGHRVRTKAQAAQETFERALAAGETPPQHVTRGALMVLKGQIVEREFEATLGIKLTRAREITFRIDPCAFEAGRTAGDRVNLNRPIGQEWNVAGLLA